MLATLGTLFLTASKFLASSNRELALWAGFLAIVAFVWAWAFHENNTSPRRFDIGWGATVILVLGALIVHLTWSSRDTTEWQRLTPQTQQSPPSPSTVVTASGDNSVAISGSNNSVTRGDAEKTEKKVKKR